MANNCNNSKGGKDNSTKEKSNSRRFKPRQNQKNFTKDTDDKEVSKGVDMRSKTNDKSWYQVLSPQLIEDAAHINFSWPAGMTLPLKGINEGYLNANLMALHSIPTINWDAARTAMWTMYSAIRQVNSGAKNYTPEDLFAALINGTQIYSALNWAIRFYTMSTMFNGVNRSVPHVFFAAEHADLNSFIDNRADYRAMLNAWIYKFGTISLPNFMPIFAREAFLYQNIYTEGTNWKDQMYMFVPDMFWTVSLDTTSGHVVRSNVVKVLAAEDTRVTPTVVDGILNALYQNTVTSESFNIISGDLAKMYPNNLIQVTEIGPDLKILPIYDHDVLEQIKNAKIYNVDISTNNFSYGGIDFAYTPQATLSAVAKFANTYADVITTDIDTPKAVDIVELTRLIPHFDENGSYICAGSDIIRQIELFAYNCTLDTVESYSLANHAISFSTNYLSTISRLTQFKYCPNITFVRGGSDTTYVLDGFVHNLDNFGIIYDVDLASIHYAALLNLYYVPVKGVSRK
jgi:hypothetical protein